MHTKESKFPGSSPKFQSHLYISFYYLAKFAPSPGMGNLSETFQESTQTGTRGCLSERVQECHQVGSFLVGETKAEVFLVVAHNVFERRGDAVVEVRGARGQRT